MTIYDISRKSGVSIATVSRVINGKKGVSEATRQRVLSVMAEKGYTPNAFARGLGLNSIKTVGVMCMDVSDIYLASAVSALERELRARGYDALLCCTGSEQEDRKSYLGVLLSKRVDAVILVGSHFVSGDVSYIISAAQEVPVILINGYLKADNVYCVLCDDFGSVSDAVKCLLSAGRRRVVYLYDTDTYSGKQKLEGYRWALTQAGMPVDERLIVYCEHGIAGGIEAVGKLFDSGVLFDAVVASEDELAVAAIKASLSHGLQVPRDVSIIGYNNSILSRCCEPELTTVDSRVEALCMTAISTLFGVFGGKDFPSKTLLSGELIQRRTTRF
ncbi:MULTISPECIES: LacI family DNA-binding transcriptional regulator [Anaerotruncus]|jgi:LacI family transcriptional regulator|uniref:LacI family DNA-binding transcriptional regulator n=1 Tax=Anaerotruncus TaxID=244127 RepID=UPI000829E823|nr:MULTISPECIES: LacI family DNA-binding transcriptional regulator [Anaerotruncus]RGX55643.1 LacI family transcriptional regulator [Anaerotruncus sp. AF02-27]